MTNNTTNKRHSKTQTTLKVLTVFMLGSILLVPGAVTQSYAAAGDFILKFGTPGSGIGQFSNPVGIAVDSNDNILVADGNNDRIQTFDSAGTFVSEFGTFGSGNGQFVFPLGVAVDSNDNIIVDDTDNHRIQIFDSTGTFVSEFGTNGSGNGEFSTPLGVTINSSDNIIVADTFNHRIQIFDSTGTFVSEFGTNGSGNGEFSTPSAVAVDSNDNIIVADTFNNRIQIFDSTGTFVSEFGTTGFGDGQFSTPRGITVNSSDNIIVADTGNFRIQIFDSTGTFVTEFGTPGVGDGELVFPQGVTVDSNDNIIVADTDNNRIQIFDGTISQDTEPPVITLNGDNPVELIEGQTYTEAGATVTDDSGEDLSASLVIDDSAVDTNTAGTYSVTYDVSDSAGNDATTVIRTVNVISAADAVSNLISTIENAGYPNGVEKPLLAPLKNIEKLLNDGNLNNDGAVCNKLTSFIGTVDAKENSGQLPSVDAAELRAAANNILDALGC